MAHTWVWFATGGRGLKEAIIGAELGGHTRTVDVAQDGISHPVDVGFVVFNHQTYPRLTRLFESLGVATTPSEMSFSVRMARTGRASLEWAGTNLDSVFAQRRNLVDASFWGMLTDILRFNRLATDYAMRQPMDHAS